MRTRSPRRSSRWRRRRIEPGAGPAAGHPRRSGRAGHASSRSGSGHTPHYRTSRMGHTPVDRESRRGLELCNLTSVGVVTGRYATGNGGFRSDLQEVTSSRKCQRWSSGESLQGVAMRLPRHRFTVSRLMRVVAIFSGLFWFLFFGPFVEVSRPMTFAMTWRIVDDVGWSATKQAHVVFTFRDYPGHIEAISSDDVASYLRGLGSETVDVTFEVTTILGSTRGTRIIGVGGFESGWVEEISGSEWHSGSPPLGPSPFP